MTLEIEYDPVAEEVKIVVDQHLHLHAFKYSASVVKYHNFDKLDDEELHSALKSITDSLLNLTTS